MQTKRTKRLSPIAPAMLLLAMVLPVAPAQAQSDGYVEVRVDFDASNQATLHTPPGWQCVTTTLATPLSIVYELECYAEALGVSWCTFNSPVVAGVTSQSGDLGHTVAVAICGANEGVCNAFVVANIAFDCQVTVAGDGPAKCAFVTTANVNYNRVGYCNYPIF